jgi:hypothetical protein
MDGININCARPGQGPGAGNVFTPYTYQKVTLWSMAFCDFIVLENNLLSTKEPLCGYACALQRGEVFRRMKLKLHNITNVLPIKIMHGLSSIMLCALGSGEAL